MSQPIATAAAVATPATSSDPAARPTPRAVLSDRARLARAAVLSALPLGALADSLVRADRLGADVPVWIAAVVAALLVLAHRRDGAFRREGALWGLVAVVLALPFAWRDAGMLLFFDLLGVLLALALCAMSLSGIPASGILAARMRDVARAALASGFAALSAAPRLALRDTELRTLLRDERRSRGAALLRAGAFTLPVLALFLPLLKAADPIFDSLVRLPGLDFATALSHTLVTLVFAWLVGGWMQGAILTLPRHDVRPQPRLVSLGALDVGLVLGALDALFALFVVVQLGWLFGGEALVRRTTGLSYAEYARRGFFELTWVASLTIPVLLGTRMALDPADARARARWRLLARLCLLLLGAIIVSAALRMALYVRYYGPSVDRIYAAAIMTWIALVLVALALTVLRERPRLFAAGAVGSAVGILVALNLVDPSAYVARAQIARTATTPHAVLDVAYLASLDADAVPPLVGALLTLPASAMNEMPDRWLRLDARCRAAQTLVGRWGTEAARGTRLSLPPDTHDWRAWNLARSRARTAVLAHEAELRAFCPDAF